jgi:hypothetical protein
VHACRVRQLDHHQYSATYGSVALGPPALIDVAAPWLYGKLIETAMTSVFYGYLLGGGMMLLGAAIELWLGINAEGQSLEQLAAPLSARPSPRHPAQSARPSVYTISKEQDDRLEWLP